MRRGKACGTHNLSPTPVYRRNDFSANDIYGFINWKRMQRRQAKN